MLRRFLEYIAPRDKYYQDVVKTGKNRVLLIGAAFYLCFFLIGVKVVQVTLIPKDYYANYVANREENLPSRPAVRHSIFDRNGILLATTLNTRSVFVNPQKVEHPKALATALAKILPSMSYADIYRKVTYKKARFVWIKHRLTPHQQYALNALGNVAVDFIDSKTRVYPQQALLGSVLGYVNIDNKGIAGLEWAFNKTLLQRSITLSLDMRVQYIVRSEVQNVIAQTHAAGGAGIVMDVNSGQVIALVSLPDFDPNHARRSGNHFNRATLGVYELGSTFKILNTAMALDSRKVSIYDTFDARRPLRVGGFTIHDFHGKYRVLSVPEIFIYSSNIGSAKMAFKAGTQTQMAFMKKLGLLSPLPMQLPEAGSPLQPKHWGETETATIAFGHGIAVTPLHLVSSIAALVNGGIYHTPTFLLGKIAKGKKVIDKDVSSNIRKILWLNTIKGTGKNAAAKGYMVGGKTGTADIPENGGYDKWSDISSYVAIFPIQKPRYVVYVLVDDPKQGKYTHGFRPTGGWVAAPAIKKIITRIAPLLKVIPVDEHNPKILRALQIPKRPNNYDVAGMQ